MQDRDGVDWARPSRVTFRCVCMCMGKGSNIVGILWDGIESFNEVENCH